MKCSKKSFDTIDEARLRLTQIFINSNRSTKPIRPYLCNECGKYHLTSKTKQKFQSNLQKKRNFIKTKNKKHENNFIKTESEYWEKKFGID